MGTVFLRSVDTSDNFKSGEYIYGLMEEVIGEELSGIDRPELQSSREIIGAKKKTSVLDPTCSTLHHPVLRAITEDEEIKTAILRSQRLTNFHYNHGWALRVMRKETQNSELIRPAFTRFDMHFLAPESILKHQDDL